MQICRSLVGGKAVAGAGPTIDKIYPATGEVIARIEPADESILDAAVAAASTAQTEWAARSSRERGRILGRAAQLLRDNNDALARLEVMDVGKCLGEAVSADVPSGADAMEYFGALAQT
ncbi:MAG: aldehyde dehydrogenase family protein, partial [Pseudomonadota bacterium]|nr:aldehyde dehydrogenase family protein [Pseudomonadota bacterium]